MKNESMPGLFKIGYTLRPVEERLQEANQPNTWIPTPFSLELYKCVANPHEKEATIHKIFDAYRINPKREFFRVELDRVKLLFDLMDSTQPIEPETTEVDARISGDNVLRMFLDAHIYPLEGDVGEPVSLPKIQAAFQTWKRANGYTNGNAMKIRDLLLETYGKPNRGEGWTTFRFRG